MGPQGPFPFLSINMNITIAGYGPVGKAHHKLLQSHWINIYDPQKGFPNFTNPDCVIICVSTPPRKDGSCEMKNVWEVIDKAPNVPILIKSTISIDGWDMLIDNFPDKQICFSPEFLRAKTATEDLLNTKEILIGGNNVDFWSKVFDCDIVVSDPRALILSKYFRNAFLATKVNFFNQMYDLCKALDMDYNIVKQFVVQDTRIGSSHTKITDERGFGGHCFPKDVQALLSIAKKHNVDLSLVREALAYNNIIQSL